MALTLPIGLLFGLLVAMIVPQDFYAHHRNSIIIVVGLIIGSFAGVLSGMFAPKKKP